MPISAISCETSVSSRKPPLRTAFAILSLGIATTTKFEGGNGRKNCSTDHVRWRRHAALAGFTRSPSEAILAAVRRTFDVPEYNSAGVGARAVRASNHHHQQSLSLHGAGATDRNRC